MFIKVKRLNWLSQLLASCKELDELFTYSYIYYYENINKKNIFYTQSKCKHYYQRK